MPGLAVPAPAVAAPVFGGQTGTGQRAPLLAGGGDGGFVRSVKHHAHPLDRLGLGRRNRGAVQRYQTARRRAGQISQRRGVGHQQHRLIRILRAALDRVRQEAVHHPQMPVQRGDPLGIGAAQHHPQPDLQRLADQHRQQRFGRVTGQVVEARDGHRLRSRTGRAPAHPTPARPSRLALWARISSRPPAAPPRRYRYAPRACRP